MTNSTDAGDPFTDDLSAEGALLPCPFCGGNSTRLTDNPIANMWWVACRSCGLEAPCETGTTKDEAVAYWNTRALASQTPEVEAVAILRAKDLQALHRKIYEAVGLDRRSATMKQKHDAQRRYTITRTGTCFVATPLQQLQSLGQEMDASDAGAGEVTVSEMEIVQAADHLISLYERLWKGGVVRDLPKAIGAYHQAKVRLATQPKSGGEDAISDGEIYSRASFASEEERREFIADCLATLQPDAKDGERLP